jgi:hypothetical protein
MMDRQKKYGNHCTPSNKLVQEPHGNEEKRHSDSDSNKTNRNDTNEPKEVHKDTLKEEILQVISEHFIVMILDMVNQNL